MWVILEPQELGIRLSYLAFGGDAGAVLGDIMRFPAVKHTKANATGFKAERPNLRKVPMSAFKPFPTITALSDWLFGPPQLGGSAATR